PSIPPPAGGGMGPLGRSYGPEVLEDALPEPRLLPSVFEHSGRRHLDSGHERCDGFVDETLASGLDGGGDLIDRSLQRGEPFGRCGNNEDRVVAGKLVMTSRDDP